MQKQIHKFFYLDIYFKENEQMEQNSGFKLERNKDLTFIVIIIDID